MNEKELIEYHIRQAEGFIQEAKNCLHDEWEKYADVQRWMGDMENMRLKTDILLSKFLRNELT